MDLEVVARHALLFDNDAMAAFVNSGDALVDWHSLKIDRYDVRHLLSAPPPPRSRNRSFEPITSDDPSVEFLIEQERYIDLPLETDLPEVKEEEKSFSSGGYRSVAFSYGHTDDSTDQKNTDVGMEASVYLPPFSVPGDILQSLPPTEKVHQIIARTATFVSKHGGQSEIVLRVKQGDNPTFGFLMPDHHLHAYFRYLVEHPELMRAESQDERKTAGTKHNYPDNVGGALSLLGSVYGSGEDEDADDFNASPSLHAKNMESVETAAKDESTSTEPIISKKEKVPAVKKNSLILGSKPKCIKGIKKGDISAMEEKLKSIGATSKQLLEPPPEIKKLIDKLVEFVMRNGKQFEATILEQDSKLASFSFLLPSNQYNPYYLNALKAAEESNINGKSFYPGQEDQNARGISKIASVLKQNHSSYSASEFSDVPFESDKKEKFKMVIGKSKKEAQETEKESQESGFTVDAAAAAAILQAATKGMKSSCLQIIRSTATYSDIKEDGQPASLDSLQTLRPYSTAEKSDHLKTWTASHGAAGGAESSVANLTEEQKLKAERLKRAKMFVAMLRSGALPSRTGTSRGSSAEPMEPGMFKSAGDVGRASQEREGSLAPAVVKPGAKGNFDERQSEQRSKRKYRSRSIGSEDEEDGRREGHSSTKNGSSSRRHGDTKSSRSSCHSQGEDDGGICKEEQYKKDNEHHSKRTHRSRSTSHKEDEEVGNAVEKDRKHSRRRRRPHSSSEQSENGEERDAEHKHYRTKHRSRNSQSDDDEREGTYKEERDKEHQKTLSRRSSGSKSRRHKDNSGSGNAVEKQDRYYKRKHSSYDEKGGESSGDEKDHKRSKEHKKQHSSHSSYHSRHGNGHSSKDRESRCRHSTSDEEYDHRDQSVKEVHDVREESEEGEIGAKVSQDGKRETSVGVITTEVPADFRAKIRAMLMATRS